MLRERMKLMKIEGRVDVGFDDSEVVDVSLEITPKYAAWLKRRGRTGDVVIMQSEPGALSTQGPAKHAIHDYIDTAITLVESLIEKGVPERIALQLLPHELYCQLNKKK